MPSSQKTPFEKVKSFLVGIGEYKKFCDIFTIHRSLEEIFTEFWERNDIVKLLRPPETNEELNRKGKLESDQLRAEGNRLYKEKIFEKALLAYNYSVLTAPTPTKDLSGNEQKKNINSFQSLPLAYANRSALLYETGRYEDSIKDIDRAIHHGYPTEKLEKLEERKGKCLLYLNDRKGATAIFKRLMEIMKSSPKKSALDLKQLERLLEQCGEKNNFVDNETNTKHTHIFYRGPEYPQFVRKQSKSKHDINMVNGSIKVQHSASKGRHLVATRDIEPGEVLIVERASYAILKLNSKIRSYCCVCMRKAPIVLPCSTCSLVAFCSEDCQNDAKNLHSKECSLLPILMTMQLNEEVGLVFRTLLSYNMEDIKLELNAINEKATNTQCFDSKASKVLLQFINSYEILHSLEGNRIHRDGESMVETATYAVVAVQLMQRVPEFWQAKQNGQPVPQDSNNLILLGAEIMKLIMNFQCNIHCLKELQVNPNDNILSADCYESGYGVFNTLSLMNHSCVPNVLHSNWGDTKFLYSIAFIPKGEEILDSYGERYVSHEMKTRRSNLKEGYYFDCDCRACLENWPLFNNLPSKYFLKCNFCDKPLSLEFQCNDCKRDFKTRPNNINDKKKSSLIYDAPEIVTQLEKALKNYASSYSQINSFNTSFANVKKISKYISLLSRFTHQPHMPLIEAQEALLRSFDLMGSYSYLMPLMS